MEMTKEEAIHGEQSKKKHFILVHGIGHGAWCWYKLVAALRAGGHRVTAVDLAASGVDPRRLDEVASFEEYARPLVEAVAAAAPRGERVVLVGHSYGGVALALAMERFPEKIAAAVFASAVMLSPTTSFTVVAEEYFKGNPLEGYMDSKVEITEDQRGLTVSFGRKYLSARLYQLTPPQDLELASLLVRPGSFFSNDLSSSLVLTESNYGSVKRVFVLCKDDRAIAEDFQLWMVERSPGAAVMEIDGADHMVMLSRPKELCSLLLQIAQKYQ